MHKRRVAIPLTGFAILALPLSVGAQTAPGGQGPQASERPTARRSPIRASAPSNRDGCIAEEDIP